MQDTANIDRRPQGGGRRFWLAAECLLFVAPLGVMAALAPWVGRIAAGETMRLAWDWVPSLGVALSFYVDGLSLLFAFLIAGVGAAVFGYAPWYLGRDGDRWRLYGWLALFMVAMLGLVMADNVITLFMFWELTSVTSYMLIGL